LTERLVMTKEFPKKTHIISKIDIDSVSFDFGGMTAGMLAMKKTAQESGEAIISAFQYTEPEWLLPHDAIKKMADYLGQAAAHLWGVDNVTKEWHYHPKTDMFSLAISVMAMQKTSIFAMKFTSEYFIGNNTKDAFFDTLRKMCMTCDDKLHIMYALHNAHSIFAKDVGDIDQVASTFPHTMQSYEYLKSKGYLDQLDFFWDNPNGYYPYKRARQFGIMNDVNKDWWHHGVKKGDIVPKFDKDLATGGHMGGDDYGDSAVLLREICPGLNEKVKYPCGCKMGLSTSNTIQAIIIHLNDKGYHENGSGEWSREEIADWLESLDVDLSLRDNSTTTEKEN
jgi:hypothetical protein